MIPDSGATPFQPQGSIQGAEGPKETGAAPKTVSFEVKEAVPEQIQDYTDALNHEKEMLNTILKDSPASSPESIQDFSKQTGRLVSQIKSKRVSLQESEKWVNDLSNQVAQLKTQMALKYSDSPDLSSMSQDEIAGYLNDQNQMIDLQSDLIVAQKNTSRLRDEVINLQEDLNDILQQYSAAISYVNEATIRLGDVSIEKGHLPQKIFSLTITAEHFKNIDQLEQALKQGGTGLNKQDKKSYDFISKRLVDKIKGLAMRMEGSSDEKASIRETFLLTPTELRVLAQPLGIETSGMPRQK